MGLLWLSSYALLYLVVWKSSIGLHLLSLYLFCSRCSAYSLGSFWQGRINLRVSVVLNFHDLRMTSRSLSPPSYVNLFSITLCGLLQKKTCKHDGNAICSYVEIINRHAKEPFGRILSSVLILLVLFGPAVDTNLGENLLSCLLLGVSVWRRHLFESERLDVIVEKKRCHCGVLTLILFSIWETWDTWYLRVISINIVPTLAVEVPSGLVAFWVKIVWLLFLISLFSSLFLLKKKPRAISLYPNGHIISCMFILGSFSQY